MLRRLRLFVLSTLGCGLLLAAGSISAAWPDRPVTLVVGWVMGSGTDLIARELASGLQKELGVPVSVLNYDGADGVFGHSQVAFAQADGYTLGLVTPDFLGAYWQKHTDYSFERFTPIARVEQSPAVFWVSRDSHWRSLGDALAAIRRARPGTLRMSGMAVGGAYHIAMTGLLKANGLRVDALRNLPSDGPLPGFEALAKGWVEICPDSFHDGAGFYRKGMVRPLAVLARERLTSFPDIPTVREVSGKPVIGGTWRTVMAPADLPADIRSRLTEAVLKVASSQAYRDFLAKNDFGSGELSGDDLRQFLAEEHRIWGDALGELGLRKRP